MPRHDTGWFCSLRARALGGLCYPSFVYINLSSLPSASAVLEKVLSLRISFSLLSGAFRVVGWGYLLTRYFLLTVNSRQLQGISHRLI